MIARVLFLLLALVVELGIAVAVSGVVDDAGQAASIAVPLGAAVGIGWALVDRRLADGDLPPFAH